MAVCDVHRAYIDIDISTLVNDLDVVLTSVFSCLASFNALVSTSINYVIITD